MKQNHMFKKTMALMMALLLLGLAGCTGPKRTGETIDIITDEGKKTVPLIRLVTDVYWDQTNLNSALRTVPGNGREFHVSCEALPREDPERDNYLTRMRTEMMAGKGPDVFLMDMTCSFKSLSANSGKLLDPLFRFPEQAMDNRLFLPLDEYMEASSTNYDAFRADLMEACSNEEGQQILPLTYAVDTVPLKEGTYDFPEESALTQQGMLESGDLRLEYYASFLNHMPLQYFGRDADYGKEELTFTEDELYEQAMIWYEHWKRFDEGYYESIINSDGFDLGLGMFTKPEAGYDFFPARNRDDGVTAYVDIAGMINRNTCCPEYAFRVLETLSGESVMRDSALYGCSGGLVANTELGGPDKPLEWAMILDEDSYASYRQVVDQVSVAKLPSCLEQAVYEMLHFPCVRCEFEDEEDVRAAVHKTYVTMQMMLAES